MTTKSTTTQRKTKSHSAEVIEGRLWIGSCTASEDSEWIQQNGITHVVDLTTDDEHEHDDESGGERRVAIGNVVSRLRAPFRDSEEEEESNWKFKMKVIPVVIPFIRNAILMTPPNGKVLIHCSAGRSRAPAVAIAFLMSCMSMSFREAWRLVSMKRSIHPNQGLIKSLLSLEVNSSSTAAAAAVVDRSPSALRRSRSDFVLSTQVK